MSFAKVTEFENKVSEFFGAKYGVAVDCCTHGIELCLRYTNAKSMSSPTRTYLSIPFLSQKLNIDLMWRNYDWEDYYYVTDKIIDAAVLWKKDSYIFNTFMCVSFQFRKQVYA